MHERVADRGGGIELARLVCVLMGRGGASSAVIISSGDVSGGKEVSETIDSGKEYIN